MNKLSITNNKISFINSKLSNEIQLKILDLSYNRIISLLGFNNLINLEELNLSNNYISDEQLDYLSNLSMLKYLNLSNNNIKQDSFIHLLSSLGSIEKINLSNNNIESVTFNQKCQSLVQIELDANKIISFIITNNQMLPKLKYLSLCGNKLENCDSLNNLPNIEYIILNENEIKTCEFISTTQLKYLHFKSNMVTSFTIHESLSQIEFIELSYNNLSLFTIEGCHPFLKNILLDNNKLMNIEFPNRNISFKNVELIDMSYNLLNKTSYLEYLIDNAGDSVEYIVDNFGEDYLDDILKNNPWLIDLDAVIEEIKSWDGRGCLAYYDGEELELDNDYFAYRID